MYIKEITAKIMGFNFEFTANDIYKKFKDYELEEVFEVLDFLVFKGYILSMTKNNRTTYLIIK